jgi:acetylornithine deacetylase/succinyl-diaminopimelate desuccinylase-like protein
MKTSSKRHLPSPVALAITATIHGLAIFVIVALTLAAVAKATDSAAEQKLFHDIYKELIEINTTHSSGDTTVAAHAVQKRLMDAGFSAEEIQIFEPFPKKGNLVVRLKGTGEKKPILLLAHLDVVEARREDWKTDPFKLQEQDGQFVARGAMDDKNDVAAFVSILSQLKREGFRPKRDIIVALTADEERLDVPTNGAAWLVNNKRDLIQAAYGFSEAGRGDLVNGKPALNKVELAEKQYMMLELETTNPGGHAARPMKANAIYELTDALNRIAQYQFPVNLTDTARSFFESSADSSPGDLGSAMRAIARDPHDAAAIAKLSERPDLAALLRSTCVATMVQAGQAANALAQRATATLNCRILPGESAQAVEQRIRDLAGPKVTLRNVDTSVPAPATAMDPEVMNAVKTITAQVWPGAKVVPFMQSGTTDMRWFRNAGIPMYGVDGMFVDPVTNGQHGLNEHIGVQDLYNGREFLFRLVKALTS